MDEITREIDTWALAHAAGVVRERHEPSRSATVETAQTYLDGMTTGEHIGEIKGYRNGHRDGYDLGHADGYRKALADVERDDLAWRAAVNQGIAARAGEPSHAELQERRKVRRTPDVAVPYPGAAELTRRRQVHRALDRLTND
ncbi:hypothetical protein KDY119_00764 [Luteimicrobium xylanilyticum]|uniref:Essential protein Yae1 N-terminal domain-containing protein n=2 Tax=Luteimicrobium xylanilyticum TaxID=1133546 RepID=A0A5P9Q831_9MICO|nr:hypothetical protein KDY119_00764 [Luteimicrobium xylanilyticum]